MRKEQEDQLISTGLTDIAYVRLLVTEMENLFILEEEAGDHYVNFIWNNPENTATH